MDMVQLIEEYRDEKKMHCMEGSTGVANLCKLLGALGYEDRNGRMGHYGQANLGNLIDFLEDNSGAIESIVTWISEQEIPEWKENLESELPEREGECEQCGATLETFMKDANGTNLEEVLGCPNCDS